MAYIDIPKAHALEQLLNEAGVKIVETDADDCKRTAEAQRQAVRILEDLQGLNTNQPEGGTRILAGSTHISLRRVFWDLATATLSLVPKTLDPTGISQAAGLGALLQALIKLKDRVTPLDSFRLAVCRAVATVNTQKAKTRRILVETGASVDDVRSEMEKVIGGSLEDVGGVLTGLARDGVLKEVFHGDSEPFYLVVW